MTWPTCYHSCRRRPSTATDGDVCSVFVSFRFVFFTFRPRTPPLWIESRDVTPSVLRVTCLVLAFSSFVDGGTYVRTLRVRRLHKRPLVDAAKRNQFRCSTPAVTYAVRPLRGSVAIPSLNLSRSKRACCPHLCAAAGVVWLRVFPGYFFETSPALIPLRRITKMRGRTMTHS